MGLPNQFNDLIQNQLNVYAAWLPVTNNFKLGDYGIFSDGVFIKMGNIAEFDVAFERATGPDASLDFTSADTLVSKFAGGAEVDVIPAGAIYAKIAFKFQKERSFLIKAPTIRVNEIQNTQQVANRLKDTDGWEKKWKVVFQTFEAVDPLIISTLSAGTEITFGGNAQALKELKLGNAEVEVGTTKELGLKVQGKSGVIALGLFKLKLFGGGVNVLTRDLTAPGDAEFEIPATPDTDL
ncbi:hypothetical protein [Salmonirosea aquatica]|uniref:Uncharacterized protein n=1 Tax=Salmonirosea aquatica TaxID=2654236 RepID=A0A7C9BVC6_9BACT|nr:hypothetical protein [Cytophagaceae bacterium SJW1-29]